MLVGNIHVAIRQKTATVYGLRAPGSKWIRYVGVTFRLTRRYRQHCAPTQNIKNNPHLAAWLNELRADGKRPKLVRLATLLFHNDYSRIPYNMEILVERRIIAFIARRNKTDGGPPLLNISGNPLCK